MSDLLSTIEAFLIEEGMHATTFGRDALGDPKFVGDLRRGRRVWPETAERVQQFMRDHAAKKTAAA